MAALAHEPSVRYNVLEILNIIMSHLVKWSRTLIARSLLVVAPQSFSLSLERVGRSCYGTSPARYLVFSPLSSVLQVRLKFLGLLKT